MSELGPDEARELLRAAEHAAATSRATGTWGPAALLLTIGASSSLALVGIWLADTALLALPLGLFLAWVGIGFGFHLRFTRRAKRGFARRWLVTVGLWALTWSLGMFATSEGAVADNVYGVTAVALALTAITAVGAWLEASR